MLSIYEVMKIQVLQKKKPLFKKSLNQMMTKQINPDKEKEKADKIRKEQMLGVQ